MALASRGGESSPADRSWARAPPRVEANEDLVVTAIRSDTLEVRPPPIEEGEQHIAPFDRLLTEANGRFEVTDARCADGQHERLDVLTRVAGQQRLVELSRLILVTRLGVRRDKSQCDPAVSGLGPQRFEKFDRLFRLDVPVMRQSESSLREKRLWILLHRVARLEHGLVESLHGRQRK